MGFYEFLRCLCVFAIFMKTSCRWYQVVDFSSIFRFLCPDFFVLDFFAKLDRHENSYQDSISVIFFSFFEFLHALTK